MPPLDASAADLRARAERALAQGRWPEADLCSAAALARDPRDPLAWRLRGTLAMHWGLHDRAADWFQRSLACDAILQLARFDLQRARAALAAAAQSAESQPATPGAPSTPPQPRYLIIKAWGFGFWAEVYHLLSQALLAEMSHRVPVTDWGQACLFRDEPDRDAFTRFFEPLGPDTLDHARRAAPGGLFPPKWTLDNLDAGRINKWDGPHARLYGPSLLARPEPVVVSDFYVQVAALIPWLAPDHRHHGSSPDPILRDLMRRYARPRAEHAARADAFVRAHLDPERSIAVHARGSDKIAETPDLAAINARTRAALDARLERDGDARIFLMTDDRAIADDYARRYGRRLVATDALRTSSAQGVHMQHAPSRTRLGVDVLVDALIAARCAAFVGNGESNVSTAVFHLRIWPPDRVDFAARNVHNRLLLELHSPSFTPSAVPAPSTPGTPGPAR